MKYIDLFCGLGAFHVALQNLGHDCVFACDIDKGIQQLYEQNYNVKVHGDIRNIQAYSIPSFDILCAGFPCQPFSIAGTKQGFDDHTRGTLFHEIIRIASHHQPKYMVLENVKNLVTHDTGNTLSVILGALVDVGYDVSYKVLNAVHFGVPQQRERVYFVCVRKDTNADVFDFDTLNAFHVATIPKVKDVITLDASENDDLQAMMTQKYNIVDVEYRHDKEANPSKPRAVKRLFLKSNGKGGRQGERVYSVQHPGITICTGSGGPGSITGLYEIESKIRGLSVREALQMFGLPTQFNTSGFTDRAVLKYIGNSICVPVIQAIFTVLLSN